MYTSLKIISVIYISCLPISLILLANRNKMEAVDQTEPIWLSFIKIWFITPAFLIRLIASRF